MVAYLARTFEDQAQQRCVPQKNSGQVGGRSEHAIEEEILSYDCLTPCLLIPPGNVYTIYMIFSSLTHNIWYVKILTIYTGIIVDEWTIVR